MTGLWWWVFRMPHGTIAHVPASSEAEAREVLVRNCYQGAPVHSWPLVFPTPRLAPNEMATEPRR
jgi:hypothetical protein